MLVTWDGSWINLGKIEGKRHLNFSLKTEKASRYLYGFKLIISETDKRRNVKIFLLGSLNIYISKASRLETCDFLEVFEWKKKKLFKFNLKYTSYKFTDICENLRLHPLLFSWLTKGLCFPLLLLSVRLDIRRKLKLDN